MTNTRSVKQRTTIYRSVWINLSKKIFDDNHEVSATIKVAAGILLGGFCSIIQVKFAQKLLNDSDFRRFLSWAAIALVFGSFFSGPIMTLGLRARSANGNSQKREIGQIEYLSVLFLMVLFISFLLFVANIIRGSNIYTSWYTCGLIASSALQVLAARQRSWLGGNGKWTLLACQIAVDGILRIITIGLCISFRKLNFDSFVISQVFSQFLAVVAITSINRFKDVEIIHLYKPSKDVLLGVLAVWSNSTGLQMIYSSPAVTAYFGSVHNVKSSAALGLVFIFARIPITFTPAFNVPNLVTDSASRDKTSSEEYRLKFLLKMKATIIIALMVSATLFVIQIFMLVIAFSFPVKSVVLLSLFSSVATAFFIYSQRVTTWLVANLRFSTVLVIWLIAIILLLILLANFGSSVETTAFSVLIVALFTSVTLKLVTTLEKQ